MRAAAAKTSKGVARRTNGGGVNARSRLIISNTKTLATARALRSPPPPPPHPPSSLVIKAASGREKLTHYDLHKNLIPGRRRIPVMQNGSGARFALPWQATGLWWSCHLENDSWQRRPASITFRYSFLFANFAF